MAKVYEEFRLQFDAIADLMKLANEMLRATESKRAALVQPVQKVILELTRVTVSGVNDVLLLCGNGCGLGAMKIVRGMYESRWTAEYLRRNPNEVEDHIDFGQILWWQRHEWLSRNCPGDAMSMSPETRKNIEDEYRRVKDRFTDNKGRVRNQWSTKPIRQIAEAIGRGKEYELLYSLACSIDHTNMEGLSVALVYVPPRMDWVRDALVTAHANLWFALNTLNDSCELDYSDKLKTANEHLHQAWGK